ncbi:glycosyltransferase family 4 protein [Guggenheimella bovis]
MNILLISNIYPSKDYPSYGTFVKSIHDLYLKNGEEVTLVRYKKEKSGKLTNYMKFFSEMKDALRKKDYDIVNVHYPSHSAPTLLRHLPKDAVLLTTLHGTDALPLTTTQKLLNPWTRRVLKRSNLIVVSSEDYKRRIIDRYGLDPEKIVVCPPGALPEHKDVPVEVKKPAVGFVGRLIREKGVFEIYDGVEELRKDVPLELIYVGEGRDEKELKEYAKNARFIGAVAREELFSYYEQLDLLIFPTKLDESLGWVAVEAFEAGTPVLATKRGALTYLIEDGKNGYHIEADGKDIKEKLEKYFSLSKEDKETMREEAKRSSIPFKEETVRKTLKDIIERVSYE